MHEVYEGPYFTTHSSHSERTVGPIDRLPHPKYQQEIFIYLVASSWMKT